MLKTLFSTSLNWLIGLVTLYGAFRLIRTQIKDKMKPSASEARRTIIKGLQGTPWVNLTPYIIAQAEHETGGFTSPIFEENNNMFGMKEPSIRKTTAKGTSRGHAVFDNLEDSIADLVLYFEHFNYPFHFVNLSAYVNYLKERGYFEDTIENYYNGTSKWFSDLNAPYIELNPETGETQRKNWYEIIWDGFKMWGI